MTEALLNVLVSSVEEVQRSEGQREGGKSLMEPMSRAKNSGIALFSVSLPL